MPEAAPPAWLKLHTEGAFRWFPALGFGYLECEPGAYDEAYFANYAGLAQTPIGLALNAFRADLAREHAFRLLSCSAEQVLLDVGIGDGAFLRTIKAGISDDFSAVRGFDVNPVGVAWLEAEGLWGDLYARRWPVLTFWDSLEHIREPDKALAQAEKLAIVSIPIFNGPDHALRSKHYKPAEHFWYFTRAAFLDFARSCGFECVDILATESALGREGIETFVLVRR